MSDVAKLLAELYAIHAAGGPLHVSVDDYNLDDGEIMPYYNSYTDEELDALHPGGRSLRQICEELAAALNAMTVEEREAAVTRHHEDREDRGEAA